VLSIQPPFKPQPPFKAGPVPGGQKPGELKRIIADTVTVINPAKMPSGTELFFGYFNSDHALFVDLIRTSSYACSNGQEPPAAPQPRGGCIFAAGERGVNLAAGDRHIDLPWLTRFEPPYQAVIAKLS
jgi:hypothetical protein